MACIVVACIVVAHIVMAYEGMTYVVMAYVVMAQCADLGKRRCTRLGKVSLGMACMVMARVVMVYTVMACVVMAYVQSVSGRTVMAHALHTRAWGETRSRLDRSTVENLWP